MKKINLEHYPSLELCKALTNAWLSNTREYYVNYSAWGKWYEIDNDDNWDLSHVEKGASFLDFDDTYVCPSAMEMIDIIPNEFLYTDRKFYFFHMDKIGCSMKSLHQKETLIEFRTWYLPNDLATMILWLKEEKLIK